MWQKAAEWREAALGERSARTWRSCLARSRNHVMVQNQAGNNPLRWDKCDSVPAPHGGKEMAGSVTPGSSKVCPTSSSPPPRRSLCPLRRSPSCSELSDLPTRSRSPSTRCPGLTWQIAWWSPACLLHLQTQVVQELHQGLHLRSQLCQLGDQVRCCQYFLDNITTQPNPTQQRVFQTCRHSLPEICRT